MLDVTHSDPAAADVSKPGPFSSSAVWTADAPVQKCPRRDGLSSHSATDTENDRPSGPVGSDGIVTLQSSVSLIKKVV